MTALPNLSTWYRAPVGATIPAGTPYAHVYEELEDDVYVEIIVKLEGSYVDFVVDASDHHYTERPLGAPLPTAIGATILATANSDYAPYVFLTRCDARGGGDYWTTQYDTIWYDYQIAAWAPITIGETVV